MSNINGRILEISSDDNSKLAGRSRIKLILHTIYPDDSRETNSNGIHWVRKYTEANLASVQGMPIAVSFADDEKSIPLGHGNIEFRKENGKVTPVFEGSETVGHIESASIQTLSIDGVEQTVLVGDGVLYNQRYPNFVDYCKEAILLGSLKASIEICGTDENDGNIIYDGERTDAFRIPMVYDYSGIAILGVKEADENCYVIEVNEKISDEDKKEVNPIMNEDVIKALISDTIREALCRNEEYESKMSELNAQLDAMKSECAAKDAKIAELNAQIEASKKDAESCAADLEKCNSELNEIKKTNALNALNDALAKFSEDEQKVAEVEINAYKENPLEGNLDVINTKILAGIGEAKMKADEEAKIAAETNAAKDDSLDIFGAVGTDPNGADESIF